jgi:hypothetical protein
VFQDSRTRTVQDARKIDKGLERLGVNVHDAVAYGVEQGQAILDQKRREYERWVQAKVFAESDKEREVIAGKVRALESEIAESELRASPVDVQEQALAWFRTVLQKAVAATDPGSLSNALRQVYSKIVLHFRQERAGSRMRSCLLPEKTGFVLRPNSSHPQAIGSPSGLPSQTGATLPTSG